jgi:hypothetical protein
MATKANMKKVDYNVLNRPKRAIHFKKFEITSDMLNQLELAMPDDSSDDEEFVPNIQNNSNNSNNKSASNDHSISNCESADDDDDENDDESEDSDEEDDNDDDDDDDDDQVKVDGESDTINDSQRDSTTNDLNNSCEESLDEKSNCQENKSKLTKPKRTYKKRALANKETSRHTLNGGANKSKSSQDVEVNHKNGEEQMQSSQKVQRKRRGRKPRKRIERQQSDDDTEKLINSFFKKAKIVTKRKRAENKTESKSQKINKSANNLHLNSDNAEKYANEPHEKRINTGPYIRCSSTVTPGVRVHYTVFQQPINAEAESSNNTQFGEDETIKFGNKIPKDKIPPIVDTNSPWVCSLCSLKANCSNGIGDLYGPYRANLDLESDYIYGTTNENDEFVELWLHEGCAIWSPGIFMKNNRLYGMASAVKLSAELVSCYDLF